MILKTFNALTIVLVNSENKKDKGDSKSIGYILMIL
jgi:hypothetical protein